MSNQIKILAVLLTIMAAVGLVAVLNYDDGRPPEHEHQGQVPVEPPGVRGDETPEPIRVKPDRSGAAHAQGVAGVVVADSATPVVAAKVILVSGTGRTPIASTTTDENGAYRLGVDDVEDGRFELRVLHDDFREARIPSVRIQAATWVDAEPIQLLSGVLVTGQVTDGAGLPLGGARVSARNLSDPPDIGDGPEPPPRKSAATDASGRYKLRHLDPSASYALRASARGHAPEERQVLRLEPGRLEQIDFRLTAGLGIAGHVLDAERKPIRGARVTVVGLGQSAPQTVLVRTDADGAFAAEGLRAGVYVVMVEAHGFLIADEKPIAAGRRDLTLTLHRPDTVIVTVLDKAGQPQGDYHCSLRVAFADREELSNPIFTRHVTGSADGSTMITGVESGTYVAEVLTEDHARTRSARFPVTVNRREPTRVTVRLELGGAIVGAVTDRGGKPIAGATVATVVPGPMPGHNPFQVATTAPAPSGRSTVTDAAGAFRLDLLYAGRHRLKITHPQYCDRFVDGVDVAAGSPTAIDTILLTVGCRVSGTVRVDGAPTAGVRIVFRSERRKTDARKPQELEKETLSDAKGRFQLPDRLPPGSYTVAASHTTKPNPLIRLTQLEGSRTPFEIEEGQAEKVVDVALDTSK